MNQEEDRRARLELIAIIEGGSTFWSNEISNRGAVEVVRRLKSGDYAEHSPAATRRILQVDSQVLQDSISNAKARLIIPGDGEWPTQLEDLESPPIALCLRGQADLRSLALCSVAIVGARAASAYGSRLASEIALQLGERGWNVISGAAYGIDAAAHRGSLLSGAQTAAVLASGVDQPYPSGHDRLYESICENGVLVSEVLPGATPTRGRFLVRNRVIAALTRGTLVVEAAFRSGSLRTAADALTMNRSVLAMPGPVTSPTSAGCHRLIMEHKAELVTDLADILLHIGPLSVDSIERTVSANPRDHLDEEEKTLLEIFPSRGATSFEKLMEQSDLPANRILVLLGLLATSGFIERDGAGWFLTKQGKA